MVTHQIKKSPVGGLIGSLCHPQLSFFLRLSGVQEGGHYTIPGTWMVIGRDSYSSLRVAETLIQTQAVQINSQVLISKQGFCRQKVGISLVQTLR